jgi:hypothetical protein
VGDWKRALMRLESYWSDLWVFFLKRASMSSSEECSIRFK